MDLGISGLASGFDWKSLVDQLVSVERSPQQRLLTEQNTLRQRNNAYGSMKTQLTVLQTRLTALKDPELFGSRLATSSDTTQATATAATGAAPGNYAFNVTQLATTSAWRGGTNAGGALGASDDVTGLTLSGAGFSTAVTAGNFTVNGKQVALATSDTLQGVFDKISAATGGAVTGSYSAAADKITFTSATEITLGSATDSSNFLQLARLNNNGTGAITSGASLGGVKLTGAMTSANLATTVTDGGSGAGEFKINGVSIAFNSSTESIADVLARINNSAAGVSASYDGANDRFVLHNKSTGDVGMALEDVTGNFLAATKLGAGALTRGKDLRYTLNGGDELTSHSNTITDDSSGVTGLSVAVLKEGTVNVRVDSDTAKIKTAINDFLGEYNKAQALIDSQTASTTDAQGKVTANVLTGDTFATDIARSLRSKAFAPVSGLSGSLKHLAELGITTSGTDNSLTLTSGDKLDAALEDNLASVQDLFTNSTNGLAVQLGAFLDSTIGDSGSLVTRQDGLTKAAGNIDTQILDQERTVQATKDRLTASFLGMEQAQAASNQQLQFLQKRFG